jgi:hypothetical protein
VRKEEDYGALYVHLITPDTGVVVQLLSAADKPMRSMRAEADGTAEFIYLRPADYYLRCFVDSNGDGEWSTGEFDSGRRPETVYYFPQAITVKAQWDIDQDWDLRGIPVIKQKPQKLVKQKPDKEKKLRERNKEREQKLREQKRKR